MEYIEGQTIAERLLECGRLPEQEALLIARQLCAGLWAAHQRGVLHRDLKTNNIMLAADAGGRLRAVITDFGLAAEPTKPGAGSASGVLGGAWDYMAPELMANGVPSVQSDLYSLGVILYEMVTGQLPFEGSRQTHGFAPKAPGELAPGLHRRWNKTVLRCLSAAPDSRFGTAGEVASSLSDQRLRRASGAAMALVACLGIAWPSARDALVNALKPEPPPTRLAILPFRSLASDSELEQIVNEPLREMSGEFQQLRLAQGRLILIPPDAAVRDAVRRPEQAAKQLGATHAMHGEVRRDGGKVVVSARIYDARRLHRIREFSARYGDHEIRRLPRALMGMAAAAFHTVPMPGAMPVNSEVKRLCDRGISLVRRSLESADQAVAEFEAAGRIDPDAAGPFAGLCEAYCSKYQLTREQQWLEKARDALAQAEVREPDTAAVRLAAARLNRLLTLSELAISDYLRVTELEPANPQAYVGLALTYMSARRNLDAIGAFNKAIELKPDYFIAHLELGHLHHRQGRHGEAEKHLLKASELEPGSSKAHSSLGAVYVDMERYVEAESALRRSMALQPSEAALIDLGAALSLQGRDAEAIRLYEEALSLGSETTVLLVNLGDSYRRTHSPLRAQNAYRRGLAVAYRELSANPNDGGARAYAGYFSARLGDRVAAERETAQVLRLSPEDVKVRSRAVLTLECLLRREKAIELLLDAPPDLLKELDSHPDLADLRADPRYREIYAVSR
jgi:serine/threonine-protein kinase